MPRNPTPQDLDQIYIEAAHKAIALFNSTGECPPSAAMVMLKEPPQEAITAPIPDAIVHACFADNRGKDVFGGLVRALLTRGSPVREMMATRGMPPPDLIVQVGEAWMRTVTSGDISKVDRSKAVSEHPDRVEVLIIQIHTPEGSLSGTCPILENPRRAEFRSMALCKSLQNRFGVQPQEPCAEAPAQ